MIQYSRRSFEPILLLADQFSQIQMALAAGERMARLLRVETSILSRLNRSMSLGKGKEVTFEDVTFSYEPGAPVLRGVNLHIPANQRIAIVGATGAGKTTFAGLISRFYDVDRGRICINGVDVRDLSSADLRELVMVVPQTPYCFHGTIAENLKLFDPSIDDERMYAAKAAHAAPFIEALPGQYAFKLMPGGANLSQGQRRLLALARALLHSPHSILVLDEATSNIDTETEMLIQRALDVVLAGRTSIVIAHRLSTIKNSDRILVMQRGKIVEDGTHNELLMRDGLYRALYERHFVDDTI
ncbi:MAG: ATP-binding cassette domain-containing protein [Chloroflexi bacterium]|nr:ATP-binding cassette domain-containing protein [Chloroflexota bacterium]